VPGGSGVRGEERGMPGRFYNSKQGRRGWLSRGSHF
jgi:hypothetical protein